MEQEPRKSAWKWLILAAPALAVGLGAASYLTALSGYYSLWVVILVAPLALLGAVVCVMLIWFSSTGSFLVRAVWFAIGSGCILTGLTESGRAGTLLMGMALILVSVLPDQPGAPADQNPRNKLQNPPE